MNLLFGLNEAGDVKNGPKPMIIDSFQILSPYRGGYFGTLGLNNAVKSRYRNIHPLDNKMMYDKSIPFTHSEKIISTKNHYDWDWRKKMYDLVLSNGSMGVVNNVVERGTPKRRFYFSDLDFPLKKLQGDVENYELAYAITIHKAQGSEFDHVFVVIPKKKGIVVKRACLYCTYQIH